VDSNEEVYRPGGMLVVVTILLVTASWVSYLAPIAIHNFGDTFLALGARLPAPTRYLLAMPRIWQVFLVLAVPLFIWVIARSRLTRRELGRMKLAMRALIVAMLLAYGLAAWAIYTPLLELRKVI
jgi:hypothetical protein